MIVGRNGSGKSNFFAAIRFVLSDAYTSMGREERQALLHEGSGSAVMSAYVEIIFDNTDGRFPTGKDELILRRTIGQKKDEYSLDRKNATKTDVMNLLESAGFSRSNPYYIVPQGRVTTLTNMKDTERLTLLKEVAGTQVYEARRSESLKIMTETNNKRQKIDELLDYIKERLTDLEQEKEELRGYQEKDKERRCLQYTFYHREQVALSEALEDLEAQREEGNDNSEGNRKQLQKLENAIAEIDAEIGKLTSQSDLLKIDRKQLEDDRRDAARAQAKTELNVKSLRDGASATEQARAKHQQELQQVRQEMEAKESELATVLPDFEQAKAQETDVKTRLDSAEATRQRLYAKQGRNAKFRSKAERDTFLRTQIDDLNNTLATQKANRMDAAEGVTTIQEEIGGLESEIDELRERLEGWGGNRQTLADEVSNAKDALQRLQDERKLLHRENDKLRSLAEHARHEKEQAERTLSHSMDSATARGLAFVRRFKQERNITGAYGTIAELLQVNEFYKTAVEQTAGNSLFHYVVDNADTATLLADALYNKSAGRLTFMPLSQLRPRPVKYPQTNDAIPLLSKIQYDETYEKAFAQVFGKTIVCPTLKIAGAYARSHDLNAITPDGDTSNKKGALTGGYIDPRRSRLDAVSSVDKWRTEFEEHQSRMQDIERQIEAMDSQITAARGDERKISQRLDQLDSGHNPLAYELQSKRSYLTQQKNNLEARLRRRDNVDAMLKQYGDQIDAFEAELSQDFKKALTRAEETQLEQLTTSVQELKVQWNELSKARRALESRKNLLEIDLRENLQLKLDQLANQELDDATSGATNDLRSAQRELERLVKISEDVEAKVRENEQNIEQIANAISKAQSTKVQRLQQQEEVTRTIEGYQKRMDKSVAKRALLTTAATECAKNIRDLGVLPEEAFERFENTASKVVASRLKKVIESLKKYKNVNKKAFEQYNNFTTQRETLTKRRKELDSSQASIEELVQVLDQRKDEAIERTFKQVSKEFAQIFERLVPAGRGRLVIQRKTDARNEESDEERESVENYTGVGISVSFNSKHDDQQRIQQLSGGQKSKSYFNHIKAY